MVRQSHFLVFAGGPVFGLGAADAVASHLSAAGVGLRLSTDAPAISIAPVAVLHYLGNCGDKAWGVEPPYSRMGAEALSFCGERFAMGTVGAGRHGRGAD